MLSSRHDFAFEYLPLHATGTFNIFRCASFIWPLIGVLKNIIARRSLRFAIVGNGGECHERGKWFCSFGAVIFSALRSAMSGENETRWEMTRRWHSPIIMMMLNTATALISIRRHKLFHSSTHKSSFFFFIVPTFQLIINDSFYDAASRRMSAGNYEMFLLCNRIFRFFTSEELLLSLHAITWPVDKQK